MSVTVFPFSDNNIFATCITTPVGRFFHCAMKYFPLTVRDVLLHLLQHQGMSMTTRAASRLRLIAPSFLHQALVDLLATWSANGSVLLGVLTSHKAFITGDAALRFVLDQPVTSCLNEESRRLLHILCTEHSVARISKWLIRHEGYRYA